MKNGNREQKSLFRTDFKDYFGLILSAVLLFFGFAAYLIFGKINAVDMEDDRLRIITSIAPLYSYVQNIVGDDADIVNLIQPGASPHDYQFSPEDVKDIARADLLIINGAGLENWLDDILEASGNKDLQIIDSSSGIEILGEEEGGEILQNPHIWLSPKVAVQQTEAIAGEIISIEKDLEKQKRYEENRQKLRNRLSELDVNYSAVLTRAKNKNIAVFHSAYDYLARDYGLNIAVVLEETPGREPTGRELASASRIIQNFGIKSIFQEPQFSPQIVQTLADELGLEVYELDPIGTEISKDSYFQVMGNNLSVLNAALNL